MLARGTWTANIKRIDMMGVGGLVLVQPWQLPALILGHRSRQQPPPPPPAVTPASLPPSGRPTPCWPYLEVVKGKPGLMDAGEGSGWLGRGVNDMLNYRAGNERLVKEQLGGGGWVGWWHAATGQREAGVGRHQFGG